MAEQIITHDCKRKRKEKPSKKKKKQLWPNNNVINRFQGITLFILDQSSITLKTKLETSFHFSAQSDVTINPTSEWVKSHEVWRTQRPCDKILQQIHVEWRRRDYESWRCFASFAAKENKQYSIFWKLPFKNLTVCCHVFIISLIIGSVLCKNGVLWQ